MFKVCHQLIFVTVTRFATLSYGMHYLSISVYIHMVNLVVKHNWRSTWRQPLMEPRDTPLGGRSADMTELEAREPTINILLHIPLHPNGIPEGERF